MEVRTLEVSERCTEALSPVEEFERLVPAREEEQVGRIDTASGQAESFAVSREQAPLRTYSMARRSLEEEKQEIAYTGDGFNATFSSFKVTHLPDKIRTEWLKNNAE